MDIPSTAEILIFFQKYYEAWGYPLIFVAALAENILPIGFFVPGSTIIWLGAFYAHQGELSLVKVVFFGILGSFFGHNVDYVMGRTGWYHLFKRFVTRERLEKIKKHILGHKFFEPMVIYFIGYTRSLLIIGMGVFRVDYKSFARFSLIAASFWNILFGTVGYVFGSHRGFFERGLNFFWLFGLFLFAFYVMFKFLNHLRKNNIFSFDK